MLQIQFFGTSDLQESEIVTLAGTGKPAGLRSQVLQVQVW